MGIIDLREQVVSVARIIVDAERQRKTPASADIIEGANTLIEALLFAHAAERQQMAMDACMDSMDCSGKGEPACAEPTGPGPQRDPGDETREDFASFVQRLFDERPPEKQTDPAEKVYRSFLDDPGIPDHVKAGLNDQCKRLGLDPRTVSAVGFIV